jgi:hypothetical protein
MNERRSITSLRSPPPPLVLGFLPDRETNRKGRYQFVIENINQESVLENQALLP